LFLSVGSILAIFLRILPTLPVPPTNTLDLSVANLSFVSNSSLIIGLGLFIVGALPWLFPYTFAQILSLLPVSMFTLGFILLARRHEPLQDRFVMLAALFASTLSDVVLLVGVRQSVRWISERVRPLRIFLVILGQIALVALIVWLPESVGLKSAVRNHYWKLFPQSLFLVSLLNVFTAIAACAFILTLLVVLLHRIYWPIIENLFYQIVRYKIVRNHTAMASLGAACYAFAFPSFRGVIYAVLAWLISVFSGETRSS